MARTLGLESHCWFDSGWNLALPLIGPVIRGCYASLSLYLLPCKMRGHNIYLGGGSRTCGKVLWKCQLSSSLSRIPRPFLPTSSQGSPPTSCFGERQTQDSESRTQHGEREPLRSSVSPRWMDRRWKRWPAKATHLLAALTHLEGSQAPHKTAPTFGLSDAKACRPPAPPSQLGVCSASHLPS